LRASVGPATTHQVVSATPQTLPHGVTTKTTLVAMSGKDERLAILRLLLRPVVPTDPTQESCHRASLLTQRLLPLHRPAEHLG